MLLDPGSGCTSPLSIDGVAFGVVTRSTSRFLTVQVRQTVLDHYSIQMNEAGDAIDAAAVKARDWVATGDVRST